VATLDGVRAATIGPYSCRIASALVAIYDTSCRFMLITSCPIKRTQVQDGFQGDTRASPQYAWNLVQTSGCDRGTDNLLELDICLPPFPSVHADTDICFSHAPHRGQQSVGKSLNYQQAVSSHRDANDQYPRISSYCNLFTSQLGFCVASELRAHGDVPHPPAAVRSALSKYRRHFHLYMYSQPGSR
jgi:hypothetical protein